MPRFKITIAQLPRSLSFEADADNAMAAIDAAIAAYMSRRQSGGSLFRDADVAEEIIYSAEPITNQT